MTQRPLHIVWATDEAYLMPALVSASSAVAQAKDPRAVVVNILDSGISDEGWNWFCSRIAMNFEGQAVVVRHKIDMGRFKGCKEWHGSLGCYSRLLIPELLPNEDWCIYADCDTLFTDDPHQIAEFEDSHIALAAHANWKLTDGDSLQKKWFLSKGLGWDDAQDICSGFLLMNLRWFRENDGVKRLIDFVCENADDIIYPDQDALAYVCRGAITRLPNRWGVFSWDTFNEIRPACVHFCSDLPWKLNTNRYLDFNDAHKLWFLYAEKYTGKCMSDLVSGGGKLVGLFQKDVISSSFQSVVFCDALCVYEKTLCESRAVA